MTYRTSDFDFDLPPDRIAQHPAERRERSRLLVIDRATGSIRHHVFEEVVDHFAAGDLLVVNETRVFPARLRGRRAGGGEAEVLLLHARDDDPAVWTALVRPGARLRAGKVVEVGDRLAVEILETLPSGDRLVRLSTDLPVLEAIERYGDVPLPPYIRRTATAEDRERYQTVYARTSGSVAAPTAGLHFTPALIRRLESRGVGIERVLLHVGVGTFRPVEAEDPAEHRMHSEWYRVPEDTAANINRARAAGGAVCAVGTTSVRTLESVAAAEGTVLPGEGWTDLFIRPPYRYRVVDRLITNFHLPRSTLLMLVAAFAGYDLTMAAYREAIAAGYRFFSYGDSMLIL